MSDLTPQAATLTAAFSHATATPAPPATPPAAPATPPAPAEPYSPVELSPTHAAQMIEWEKENLAKGKISQEEATGGSTASMRHRSNARQIRAPMK